MSLSWEQKDKEKSSNCETQGRVDGGESRALGINLLSVKKKQDCNTLQHMENTVNVGPNR